jgi:hypothetical protein
MQVSEYIATANKPAGMSEKFYLLRSFAFSAKGDKCRADKARKQLLVVLLQFAGVSVRENVLLPRRVVLIVHRMATVGI